MKDGYNYTIKEEWLDLFLSELYSKETLLQCLANPNSQAPSQLLMATRCPTIPNKLDTTCKAKWLSLHQWARQPLPLYTSKHLHKCLPNLQPNHTNHNLILNHLLGGEDLQFHPLNNSNHLQTNKPTLLRTFSNLCNSITHL